MRFAPGSLPARRPAAEALIAGEHVSGRRNSDPPGRAGAERRTARLVFEPPVPTAHQRARRSGGGLFELRSATLPASRPTPASPPAYPLDAMMIS